MAETLELSNQHKYEIAEYVYSYNSDILIISDATTVVETLSANDLIDETTKNDLNEAIKRKDTGIATKIMRLIGEKIPDELGKSIMADYYAGKLP